MFRYECAKQHGNNKTSKASVIETLHTNDTHVSDMKAFTNELLVHTPHTSKAGYETILKRCGLNRGDSPMMFFDN